MYFLKKYSYVFWISLLSSFRTCKISKQFLEQLHRYWGVTLLVPKMGPKWPIFFKQKLFQKKSNFRSTSFPPSLCKIWKQEHLQTIRWTPDKNIILVGWAQIVPNMVHFPQTKTFHVKSNNIFCTQLLFSFTVWNLKEITLAVQQIFRCKDIKIPRFHLQIAHFPWT